MSRPRPHRIDAANLTTQRLQMASATTADLTQRKSLWAESIPLQYVVTRRYFEGGDQEEKTVKVTTDLAEAVRSYNLLS